MHLGKAFSPVSLGAPGQSRGTPATPRTAEPAAGAGAEERAPGQLTLPPVAFLTWLGWTFTMSCVYALS